MFIKIISFLFLAFSIQSFAGQVTQVKNGKVLIDLQGENASPNQNAILIDSQGKKVAIVQIVQVKNGKAIAVVTKGKTQGNEKVTLVAANSVTKDTGSNPVAETARSTSKKISGVLTLMSNTMTTKQADTGLVTEDVKMTGTTFGLTAVIDWPMSSKWLALRGTLGYEPYKAAGTATINGCDSQTSKDCDANISYLSAGGYLRVNFTSSTVQPWAGLGANLKFPMSKTTTALKQDDIKMTMTYAVVGGADIYLSGKSFIPVSAEYQMFLKSDTVSASIIMLRAGYGMMF